MKALVTGGTGFIGHCLVETLLERGTAVRCSVRSLERARRLGELGAELVLGDLDSPQSVEAAVEGVDVVLHLAGVVRAWSRDAFFRTNEGATARLTAAARKAGVGRFALLSSLAALGPAPVGGELTEDSPPRPVNAYGRSKLAGERALADAAGEMSWTIVRPCAVYGPRDRDFLELLRMVRRGWAPYAAVRGARLAMVYVQDLVDLLLLAVEKAPDRSVYLGGDGAAYSWRDIIGAMEEAVGRKARVFRVPPLLLFPLGLAALCLRPFTPRPPLICLDKLREAREPAWTASSARAIRELGWEPRHSLEEGFRAAGAWYRENGWI